MAGPYMKKMIKEFLKLGAFEMEKKKFHNSKELIDLGYWYPMRVYDKNKETNAKYFFGYKTGKKIEHHTSSFHKCQVLSVSSKKYTACPL